MMKRKLQKIELRHSVLVLRAESQRRSLVDHCQDLSPGYLALHYAESAFKAILKTRRIKVLTIFSFFRAIVLSVNKW